MENLITKHFEQILRGFPADAVFDYSKELICIAHVNGHSETLNYVSTVKLMKNLAQVVHADDSDDVEVLVNRSTLDYGVLALRSKAFAPFISYTCMVKNGQIRYVTLYISEPAQDIFPSPATQFPDAPAAKKMFYKHVRAMFSMSADVIVKDYGENAVVITNMAKDTCSGKAAIHLFCSQLMKVSKSIIKSLKPHGFPTFKWRVKTAAGGLLLFVMESKAFGTVMTETYWVEDGKIQFESSICSGEMMGTLNKLL